MTYRHGVYFSEEPTSILPPRTVGAAMPVVFGTAPVHLVEDGSVPVNTPVLCNTYKEAVAACGYSDDWGSYTLCEFMSAFFGLFNVAPVVLVNVFDPATHKTAVTAEELTFVDGVIDTGHPGIVGDPEVKNESETVLIEGTDYAVDAIAGTISRLTDGSLTAGETVTVSYEYGDPSLVTTANIVGGIDTTTMKATGLELVDSVFPMFRLVPGQIVAPGWSHDTTVAATMTAKAGNINKHFKAIAVIDLDSSSDGAAVYTDAPSLKNLNNFMDEQQVICWPKVKLGDNEYWMSSQVAGLLAQIDADNEDIPYKSPSNHSFQMDSAVADGEEVWLGPDQANYLNGNGIVTALNFIGGWKCWGNRTGCYPAVTDVKDAFLPIRRMFNWIGNTLTTTYWQKVDFPITRRLIETIVDSANIWLNGLAAREFILGGRVEFQSEENPSTDTMDGKIKFHVYITPPSPAREIDFILEYDPDYLETLFG